MVTFSPTPHAILCCRPSRRLLVAALLEADPSRWQPLLQRQASQQPWPASPPYIRSRCIALEQGSLPQAAQISSAYVICDGDVADGVAATHTEGLRQAYGVAYLVTDKRRDPRAAVLCDWPCVPLAAKRVGK